MKINLFVILILLVGCKKDNLNEWYPRSEKNRSALHSREGDVVYLEMRSACPKFEDKTCYFSNKDAAVDVISKFEKIGINGYVLPTITDDHGGKQRGDIPYLTFVDELKKRDNYFFTAESRNWVIASHRTIDGKKDSESICKAYIDFRVPRLQWLVKRYPNAYQGFYIDEPTVSELKDYGDFVNCVSKVPELSKLRYFVNLMPLAATDNTLLGEGAGRLHYVKELGGCENFTIDKTKKDYKNYLDEVFRKIPIDLVGFDFYPFSIRWEKCPRSYRTFWSENLKQVKDYADDKNVEVITYLQNYYGVHDPSTLPTVDNLIWSREVARSIGYRRFARFLSHPFPEDNYSNSGLLNRFNEPTPVYENELKRAKAYE